MFVSAFFESQCVIEGTEVSFFCYNEESWSINHRSPGGAVNFITSNITGTRDNMTFVADQNYIDLFENVSLIRCLDSNHDSFSATLLITG